MVPVPSLLVMPFAGYLAAQGEFSLPIILAINSAGALTGSLLSYWFGAAGGKPLLLRYGKWVLIRPKDLDKTEAYFASGKGRYTVIVARFLPVIRHIISIPAGIARMPLRSFMVQTFIGASLWGGGLMIVGHQLGSRQAEIMAQVKKYDLAVAVVIVLAIVAIGVRFVVRRRREAASGPSKP
ncbi:MAG: DedA family protein [Deltaproteobacteria bacterium]|nr:DedA family protein [Deltaproteobacteria bacterium]MCW5802492.1 DedA family protein [Deltaproteobacteria bacterium]